MSKMRWTLLAALVFGVAVWLAPAASACSTYRCQNVPTPSNPYCMRCVDTGSPTGANCFNCGSACGCKFLQCGAVTDEASDAGEWSWQQDALSETLAACSLPQEALEPMEEPAEEPTEPVKAAA